MAAPERGLNLRTICNELRTVRWNWFQLGIHLGIPRFKLREFEGDEDPLSAVVDFWLRGNVDQSIVPISWQTIVEVLKRISELGLAEKISAQYGQGHRKEYFNCYHHNVLPITIAVCSVLIGVLFDQFHLRGTSTYSSYLEKIYANQEFSDDKWPAFPTTSFINLAIISHTITYDLDKIREHRLHGNVTQMLKEKESIQIENIFTSRKSMIDILFKRDPSLLLVEGAPGIGKTTLTWELCRRWQNGASFMKQFSLVVLHRFREKSTQQIGNVRDLFPHADESLQQLVSDEVIAREGKGVLFILDGFDEFPHKASKDNFLIKLIKGKHLPDSTVLVTTRPAATATFLTHRHNVDRRIEILGFTQEQVQEYASATFSDYEPEVLNNFMKYIEASKNPAINSLMYIPLNAAIIAEIYKRNYETNLPFPKTLTQLYTELCLTLLRRHFLAANDSNQDIVLNKIEDLSDHGNYYSHFWDLSCIAFEEFSREEIIIHTLPKNSVHFGLLDSVQALHKGGPVSYNFLHLTIQEYLAAYHISHHDEGKKQVFELYGHSKRWSLVWRFVAGFTKFDYFFNNTQDKIFVEIEGDSVWINYFFFLCLFEAEVNSSFNLKQIYGQKNFRIVELKSKVVDPGKMKDGTVAFEMEWSDAKPSPFDMYVLGYFLVNSAPTVSWEIFLNSDSLETFVWGLNSVERIGNTVINKLELEHVHETSLNKFPKEILLGISHLTLRDSALSAFSRHLKNLKFLEIAVSPHAKVDLDADLSNIFDQITEHNIRLMELVLSGVSSTFYEREPSSFERMIHPKSGPLESLYLTVDACASKPLLKLLLGPSSLIKLYISCCRSEASFAPLEENNNLKCLTLYMTDIPSPYSLKTALERNTELTYLLLIVKSKFSVENYNKLKLVTEAIQQSKLGRLLYIFSDYTEYSGLATDARIKVLSPDYLYKFDKFPLFASCK